MNEAYKSRSGITTVENILTPAYIIHGETDIRVPVCIHAILLENQPLTINR